MDLGSFSLNALRAFEAAARHLNFTRAAEELCVTQAAVSQQVKGVEAAIGRKLFRRTTRGLVLTDEGAMLVPVVAEAMARIGRVVAALRTGNAHEVVTVGAVGTFAVGFLLDRLEGFRRSFPGVEVRLLTNNNAVDLWTESLDCAIRFGDGSWTGVHAEPLMSAPLTPLCSRAVAATLRKPADLAQHTLLRSYRQRDWPAWLAEAGVPGMPVSGPIFDTSHVMARAAILGHGVALLPAAMFERELSSGELVRPFAISTPVGGYWITRLASGEPSAGLVQFWQWLLTQCRDARRSR